MTKLLRALQGGDLRSIGMSSVVARRVLKDPRLLNELFGGIFSKDPIIRSRSADSIEKISRLHPEFLAPYKEDILKEAFRVRQPELRWHLAQILPRLDLNNGERKSAENILFSWLEGEEKKSTIVKVNSLQALTELALKDRTIFARVVEKVKEALQSESPALRSRSRKLIKQLTL